MVPERQSDQLDVPEDQELVIYVHYLCHEPGHLCMFNTTHNKNNWMSYDYRESWADYFGNILVDSLYEQKAARWNEEYGGYLIINKE